MKIIFIIGTGRSGTTLLTHILKTNSEIHSTPENSFLLTFLRHSRKKLNRIQFNKDYSDYIKYKYKVKDATDEIGSGLWKIDEYVVTDNYKTTFINSLLAIRYTNEKIDTYTQKVLIADKNPDYTFYVNEILKIFPHAKFIIACRDPRGYSNSYKQRPRKINSVIYFSYIWKKYHQLGISYIKKNTEKFHYFKYEDFINEPKNALINLSEFMGVNFKSEMLNHHLHIPIKDKHYKNVRFKKKLETLRRPLERTALDKWKNQLTNKEISYINHICQYEMKELGYSIHNKHELNIIDKLKITFISIFAFLSYFLLLKNYYYIPFRIRLFLIKYFGLRR